MEAARGDGVRQPSRRLLMRGESMIASVGLSLAALLLCVMTVTIWWTLRMQQSAVEITRNDQISAVAQMLARSGELLLQQGEMTAVRRMIADAARVNHLSLCRIVLPDGGIVASARPSEANVPELPEQWPTGSTSPSPSLPGGIVFLNTPLIIPGHGPADLQLAAPVPTVADRWETALGACCICAVAMMLHLVLYRRMRSRMRGLGSVSEALTVLACGETSLDSLLIGEELSPETSAWNRLIEEANSLRRQHGVERAREALGRRQETGTDLDTACDALSQGLLLVDDKCRVRYANGAAAVFLSSKRDELLGADVSKFLQVEAVLNAVREVALGTNRRRTVHDVERRDEGPSGVLRFVIRPVRRDDSGTAIITIEDITQQRVAEEARNRFVAQATHELRTPLTNIRLYVETAIDGGEEDPATRAKCLNVINGETRRLERIVGEMLSVAEIEAGSFEVHYDDIRLDQMFDDLKLEYAQQAADKKIELTFHLPPKLPIMQGDRDKMLLALHNLIGNSMKYTVGGGHVDVIVTVDQAQLFVQVKDSGIGIAEADQERIFDRFYRAKDARVAKITGTGLGLTLAREVVRLHGGDISVESKLDHGSTFTMKVPVTRQAA